MKQHLNNRSEYFSEQILFSIYFCFNFVWLFLISILLGQDQKAKAVAVGWNSSPVGGNLSSVYQSSSPVGWGSNPVGQKSSPVVIFTIQKTIFYKKKSSKRLACRRGCGAPRERDCARDTWRRLAVGDIGLCVFFTKLSFSSEHHLGISSIFQLLLSADFKIFFVIEV